jgi:hypothetical protein
MTTSRKTAAPPKRRQATPEGPETPKIEAAPPNGGPSSALAEADVDEFARLLRDAVPRRSDAWWHYHVVLGELGLGAARALVDRAIGIEAAGGLTVESGERKRTLGGIFFALAREQLGPEKWRALRQVTRKKVQESPQPPRMPSRPEPEVFVRRRGG